MRIALTGAGGGLGRAFAAACPSHHDLVPLTHAELDIGDHHAVMQTLVPLDPDLIVNAAAFTAVDACESDPARAARDNALGPQNLALAARAAERSSSTSPPTTSSTVRRTRPTTSSTRRARAACTRAASWRESRTCAT